MRKNNLCVFKKKNTHSLQGRYQAGRRPRSGNRSGGHDRVHLAVGLVRLHLHHLKYIDSLLKLCLDDSWNNLRVTIGLVNMCLMQQTKFLFAFRGTGMEYLTIGPKSWNSGMADSFSVKDKNGQVSL